LNTIAIAASKPCRDDHTANAFEGCTSALDWLWTILTPKAVVQRPFYPFSEAESLILRGTSAPRGQ